MIRSFKWAAVFAFLMGTVRFSMAKECTREELITRIREALAAALESSEMASGAAEGARKVAEDAQQGPKVHKTYSEERTENAKGYHENAKATQKALIQARKTYAEKLLAELDGASGKDHLKKGLEKGLARKLATVSLGRRSLVYTKIKPPQWSPEDWGDWIRRIEEGLSDPDGLNKPAGTRNLENVKLLEEKIRGILEKYFPEPQSRKTPVNLDEWREALIYKPLAGNRAKPESHGLAGPYRNRMEVYQDMFRKFKGKKKVSIERAINEVELALRSDYLGGPESVKKNINDAKKILDEADRTSKKGTRKKKEN